LFILNADFNFSRDYFDISYSLGSYFECATGNNGTNVSKMKFIIFTNEYSGLPLGLRLQEEGHTVLMALIEPQMAEEKYQLPKDKEAKEKEKKQIEYLKLNGTGLIKREWAKQVTNYLNQKNLQDETYIIFDQIYGFRYSEILRKKGYKVWGGTRLGYQLEHEREKTLLLLSRLGINVPRKKEFPVNSADQGIEFLKQIQDRILFAFKSDNPDIITLVAEETNNELIKKIEAEREGINKDRFILQEKIEGIEVNCETLYVRGKPIMANVDLEAKKKYNEMSEVQTGCAFDLVWTVPINSLVRKESNAPLDEFFAKNLGTGVLDLSFIYDPVNKKSYALEVCGSRFGYNQLYTLLATLKIPIGEYFAKILDGEYQEEITNLFEGFGASIRIFNDGEQRDQKISWLTEINKDVWLWDGYKKEGKLMTAGNESTGILTAKSETPEGAFAKVREHFDKFHMPTKWVRSDFQIVEPDLPLWRYRQLKKLKLF